VTKIVAPVLRASFSLSVCNLELFYVVVRSSIEARARIPANFMISLWESKEIVELCAEEIVVLAQNTLGG